MAKIPFKVSARTARLIGRENIASSKGAIIELVKNGYDADSPLSLIYFNQKEDCLYIIDSGEGMTQKIIQNYWMTIGTDNKAHDYFTKTGRVKAGAKGIGRFALDKLGDKCEMTTKFDVEKYGNIKNEVAYIWKVDWKEFDNADTKVIGEIEADLEIKQVFDLKKYLLDEIDDNRVQDVINNYSFENGTVLKVSELRDNWDVFYVSQVFDDLEVLVPPKEQSGFQLFLFSSAEKHKYGEVLGSVCDDYDYKIEVKADKNQNVKIQIYRNEYDIKSIKPNLFDRDKMKTYPYDKTTFEKGFWTKKTTFNELIKGFSEKDEDNTFSKIGDFEATFYFMKRTAEKGDMKKFFYKEVNSNQRKDWLNKFGGIKLFRDDFRVRPYGEINNSSFDWLGLSNRRIKSPAPVAHKSGSWKVGENNIAGSINITRHGNLDLQDKSSREGLQENKPFEIFKKLILKILDIFEEDRSSIAREMRAFYEETDVDIKAQEYADNLAKKILEDARKNKEQNNKFKENKEEDTVKIVLSKRLEDKEEEIEKLKDEQKLLRGMASSGIVIASFSHDLSKISQNLNSRIDKLKRLISQKIDENDYLSVEDRKNPFYFLKRMRKQDLKLQNWLHFSLGVARKDKRKMKQLKFKSYFNTFKEDWKTVLTNRSITLNINNIEQVSMRIYEIDIDSIFNNLLVNSIDAFNNSTIDRDREVNIQISDNVKNVIIEYQDNGSGLSKDITNHNQIFEPMFTTNVNKHTGDEEGTGLGMWLIKSIVKDNDGHVKLIYPPNGGFGIRITFPKKYIRNK